MFCHYFQIVEHLFLWSRWNKLLRTDCIAWEVDYRTVDCGSELQMDRISFGDSARKKDFLFQLSLNEIDGLFTSSVLENKIFVRYFLTLRK